MMAFDFHEVASWLVPMKLAWNVFLLVCATTAWWAFVQSTKDYRINMWAWRRNRTEVERRAMELMVWKTVRQDFAVAIIITNHLFVRFWQLWWPAPNLPEFTAKWIFDGCMLSLTTGLLALISVWNVHTRREVKENLKAAGLLLPEDNPEGEVHA